MLPYWAKLSLQDVAMLGGNQHISHDPLDHINFPMSTWLSQIIEIASKWSKSGSEIAPSWSPMQLNIQYLQPEFHSWSPAGDLSVTLVVIVDFHLRGKWLGIETSKLFANAPINVKPLGGGGQGMGWGFDCLCWPWGKAFEKILFSGGRGYLNLSSPDVGPTWGWIWLPTRTKETEPEHMFPHFHASRTRHMI